MNTLPLDAILRREIEPSETEVLSLCSEAIAEAVNIGTHFIQWEADRNIPSAEGTPLIMLFRHVLDLADAISILVKSSSIDPCKPLLRVVLETSLQIEYLLEKDSEQRGFCYLVCHQNDKLKYLRRLVHNSTEQRDYKNQLSGKSFSDIGDYDFTMDGADYEVRSIETLLKSRLYRNYQAEYNRVLATKKKRSFQWYSLFKGPNSLFELAEHLKKKDFYEFLYRPFSAAIHASDVFTTNLVISSSGMAHALNIRHTKGCVTYAHITIQLLTALQMLFLAKRYPSKNNEYMKWYAKYRTEYMSKISILDKN
jgi:hypothetical protein